MIFSKSAFLTFCKISQFVYSFQLILFLDISKSFVFSLLILPGKSMAQHELINLVLDFTYIVKSEAADFWKFRFSVCLFCYKNQWPNKSWKALFEILYIYCQRWPYCQRWHYIQNCHYCQIQQKIFKIIEIHYNKT